MQHRIRLVTFQRAGVRYAVEVALVRQAVRVAAVEAMPGAPDFVAGRSFVGTGPAGARQEVLIDLARVYSPTDEPATHAVLVTVDGTELGLLADRLGEVLDVDLDDFQPLPPFVGGNRPEWLRGRVLQGRSDVLVLDLRRVLEPLTSP
ncbi:MAG: hypothetical protein HKN12_06975 [Gemmatimonadetes bacterium]|nr:hypothetical protein [Gemmatimonadota bacterium]